ncbi:MAG: hypothetical protein FJ149_08195 [Euryarchaeota archaeon]|nr:hypothetical protein [Euryarchaeota archaeon]
MPERVVNFLTGAFPTPIFPIPLEVWDDYGLEGLETVECEIRRVIDHWGEVVRNVNRRVDCRTEFYHSILGWTGTGVVIPEEIVEGFGITPDHYLEVVLHKVKRGGEETVIYPGEMREREIRKTVME